MNILLKKTICVSLLIASIVILASCSENIYEVSIEYDSSKGVVTGSGEYEDGEEVTISAKSSEGYRFSHWEENGQKVGSTSPTISFHLTENREFKAVFEKIPKHHVIVTSNYKEHGVVNYKDYGVVNELKESVAEDKKITLNATPKDGYEFEGWFLNGKKVSSKEHDQVVIKEDSKIVGRFSEITGYSLKVNANIEELNHLITVDNGGGNQEYKDEYIFEEDENITIRIDAHKMIEEKLYKKYKLNGFYINKHLFTAEPYMNFKITEDTKIDVIFEESSFEYFKIIEDKMEEETSCEELPKEFDVIKVSPDKKKLLVIIENTAYVISSENNKCIAKYDVSNFTREQNFDRYIHWLDNSDGFYIVRDHNSEGYQTLKVFYLDYRLLSIETSQDFLLDSFFDHIENKGSTISYCLGMHLYGYSFVYPAIISIDLESLETSVIEIFENVSTEVPVVHGGIVLSDKGDKLFYNYKGGQIWDVNKDYNSTETKGNGILGSPKYWLNENQVLSLVSEDSIYITYGPFFAHLYIYDAISEETILVDSDLNSIYDIKRIDNPNNLDRIDSYITGSRESDKTIYYLTTIKNELKQMTSVYAADIFSKRDLSNRPLLELDSDIYRRKFIEDFPKKYDKYVESSNHELFSLQGDYQFIEEAIYMKDGTILIVIRNEKYKAKDKKLVLIDSDRDANVIYENSKGFVLIDCFEDLIKIAVPNDSGKYELESIDY
ncbi:MAG: InlB B-repeat-containing protein [Clostridia bacterium]